MFSGLRMHTWAHTVYIHAHVPTTNTYFSRLGGWLRGSCLASELYGHLVSQLGMYNSTRVSNIKWTGWSCMTKAGMACVCSTWPLSPWEVSPGLLACRALKVPRSNKSTRRQMFFISLGVASAISRKIQCHSGGGQSW